jgi:predicted nucleotidyltransferase component of viral defense system
MALHAPTHKSKLLQILKDIYSDPAVGRFLGFKGGTAAYLFYGLERFSVDLDFDLLDETKEDDVFVRVKEILERYGKVPEARKKRYSLLYLLSYTDKAEGHQNVKVEINRRTFGSRYEVKPYLGISMKVMAQEDMAAHKLVAMYERMSRTNRDIFDVWFFLKNDWPVNEEIVTLRTKLSSREFLERCIAALEKMSDRNILHGMGELLTEKQKVWAKAHLLKETIFQLKLRADVRPVPE